MGEPTASATGTQRERTELGWRRTGLAAAALTGVFVRSRIEKLDAVAIAMIVISAAVVLIVVSVCYRRPSTTDGRVSAVIAALVAAIAAAQLAAIALS